MGFQGVGVPGVAPGVYEPRRRIYKPRPDGDAGVDRGREADGASHAFGVSPNDRERCRRSVGISNRGVDSPSTIPDGIRDGHLGIGRETS